MGSIGKTLIAVGMFMTVALCVFVTPPLQAFTAEQSQQPEINGKVTVLQEGPNQGMWVENQKCTMAIISVNEAIAKYDKDTVPYVCVYVKDEAGKLDSMPVALNFQGGELQLQIPKRDSSNPRIVSLRRITALLDAADNLHNAARN